MFPTGYRVLMITVDMKYNESLDWSVLPKRGGTRFRVPTPEYSQAGDYYKVEALLLTDVTKLTLR